MQDDFAGEAIAGSPSEAYQSLEVLGVRGRPRLDLDSDDPVRRVLQDQIDLQPTISACEKGRSSIVSTRPARESGDSAPLKRSTEPVIR